MLLIDASIVAQSPVMDLGFSHRVVEKLFAERKEKKAVSAQEIPMFPPSVHGGFYSLPAYIESMHTAGIKWTTHVKTKSASSGSYTKPIVVLNDFADGAPVALLDGLAISAIRTASVSCCFYRHLGALAKGKVLCCGAGHQATWQVLAVLESFPAIQQIYIWSRQQDHARDCVQAVQALAGQNIPVSTVENFETVLGDVDFVIGATSAETPYLHREHLEHCSYVHIGMNDIDAQAIRSFPHIVCDDFESAKARSAQSLFRLYRTDPSIQERVSLLEDLEGPLPPHERFFFDSFGLSIFDVGLAWEVYRFAQEKGLGRHWDLFGR